MVQLLDTYAMRLMSVEKLIGGEVIGRDIFTSEGGILLKASSRFKPAYKKRLLDRSIHEVYIDDELSKGIMPYEIMRPQIKTQLLQQLNTQFKHIENVMCVNLQDIEALTNIIIDELSNHDIMLDLMDLKCNDSYTYSHCLNVSVISCALAKKMGFNYEDIKKIVIGALLHDIGKIMIPKDILNKPGQLTAEERNIIQTHCQIGYDIIKNDSIMSPISKVIILCHHEREDGKGYPLSKGEDLHMGAKLVAVADVFDALVSNRPYREGFPINRALTILRKEKLNEYAIKTLESMVAFYPVGTSVKLSNNLIALVEQNFTTDLNRPLVRVIYDLCTNTIENYRYDLRKELNVTILEKVTTLPSLN